MLGHYFKKPGAVSRRLVRADTVGPLELGQIARPKRGDVAQRAIARDDEWRHAFGARHREAIAAESLEQRDRGSVELNRLAAACAPRRAIGRRLVAPPSG